MISTDIGSPAAKVLDLIDRTESSLVSALQGLLRIPSVWGDAAALTTAAQYLAGHLDEVGVDAALPFSGTAGMPNLLARWGGNDETAVIFNGHMEVYPPSQSWTRDPFGGEISDGRIYGVGVSDMKAGTAALAMALKMLAQAGIALRRDVVMLGVPNHFEGGEGTRQALRDGLRAEFAINGEPSGLKVLTGQRGIAYVEVTVHGRAAHTTALDIGVNAVDRAARVVQEVLAMPITGRDGQVLSDVKICNVAQISGGVAHNLVPERCEITFDFRFPGSQSQEEVLADVRHAVERALDRLDEHPVEVALEATCVKNPRSSLRIEPDEPIVNVLADAHQAVTGRRAEHALHQAWPDTPIFWESGIKAVTYGPGSMDCYWDDESVSIAEYLTAIRTYALAAIELAGVRGA